MSRTDRPPTLRREILIWYSAVLLGALGIFALVTYLLLQGALERSSRSSLRQTANMVEQLTVPQEIPRIRATEQIAHLGPERLETLRRRTQLATGEVVEVYVARSEDVETQALRSFLIIAMILIPLTAAAAALGGRALLERLLNPLERLVDTTREIGIGGLSRRVSEPQRPAELRDLAQSFNAMLMRLERAVDALGRFTADASHELRTPLTSIKGTVQVALARPRTQQELEETLAQVAEETDWMLHLVDGLLTLARGEEVAVIDGGETVELEPLLGDVAEMGQALVGDKPVTVRLEISEPLNVRGRPGQLRQVFLNLVSNAAKFTEEGSITIRAERSGGGEDPEPPDEARATETETWCEVVVEDTGVGIDAREVGRIFDRFYRGDAARSHPAGAGLGLAIAKLLVERHGGSISAESSAGVGSRFVVRLPRA